MTDMELDHFIMEEIGHNDYEATCREKKRRDEEAKVKVTTHVTQQDPKLESMPEDTCENDNQTDGGDLYG